MSVIAEGTLFADEEVPNHPDIRAIEKFVDQVAHLLADDTSHNIAEDIMEPAYERDPLIVRELGQLCAVFTLLLDRVGSMMLESLRDCLCVMGSRRTLERFTDTLHVLSCAIGRACDIEPIDAFRLKLLEELTDEYF
jgi:hypothetical protein